MEKIVVLGIDLAKNVFQLHGVDDKGRTLLKKRLSRDKLMSFIANMPMCTIAMESCSSASYWGREFQKLGHLVKLISPQFVKPYVKTNKNDMADAEAICEAATRPNMRFVPIKTVEAQDIQVLHKAREKVTRIKVILANELRGLMAEYGIVVPQGINKLLKLIPSIIEDTDSNLTPGSRDIFRELLSELRHQIERLKEYDKKILSIKNQNDKCRRLAEVDGIGPVIATAIVANCSAPENFKSGREYAAYLGLVPRQYSSGGRNNLYGISKRGNVYLRKLLVQGAKVVIFWAKGKKDKLSLWINTLRERAGLNKTAVALANKMARIAWKLLRSGEDYLKA